MLRIKAIVAIDKNWGIGKEGQLLTHLPSDLRRFQQLTHGHTVVMGRKTLESLPDGKPLKGRFNIVISRDAHNLKSEDNLLYLSSIEEVMSTLRRNDNTVFIIGGGQIYKQFLPYCNEVHLTRINSNYKADTHFPNIEYDYDNWVGLPMGAPLFENNVGFAYQTFIRKSDIIK